MLAEGNIFGNSESDEFTFEFDGETRGIFKRFEYLSIPFSITGNQEKFRELIEKAKQKRTSFKDELLNDSDAQRIAGSVFDRMEKSPSFTRQTLDILLSRVYVDDNILANTITGDELEDCIAKIAVCWEKLADFYCIEGLVGGGGERNPFNSQDSGSFIAGGLDSLEKILPSIKKRVSKEDWDKACLKLSSVIGRNYHQIDNAVDVIEKVFRDGRELSEEELRESLKLVDDLARARFETNTEMGKFYNTLIRFHNWIPLTLKKGTSSGSTYDSVCVPTEKALSLLEENSEINFSLKGITDATSPKGLALVALLDENKLGSKKNAVKKAKDLEERLSAEISEGRKDYSFIRLSDSIFYPGLVGGKWRGLKLLHDSKEAVNFNYEIPEGFVVSTLEVERILSENGIKEIIENESLFALDETKRREIIKRIDGIDFSEIARRIEAEEIGDSLIVRSSMYGEDGGSNFAGTYDSVPCEKGNIEYAVRQVIKSYF